MNSLERAQTQIEYNICDSAYMDIEVVFVLQIV